VQLGRRVAVERDARRAQTLDAAGRALAQVPHLDGGGGDGHAQLGALLAADFGDAVVVAGESG